MKRIFLLFFILNSLFFINIPAQTEVAPFHPGATADAVCYYLPKTAIRVVLTAEKAVVSPGEFAKYAFKYLRLQNVPIQQSVTWRIKKVELQAYGVPDKDKAYTIRMKNRTVAPLVSLTNDGIILGINTDVAAEALPNLPEAEKPTPLPDAKKYMNQDMLSAGSAAKMADLVAEEIYDIRDSRGALLRGEAENTPKDGAQLQLMLNGIDQEDAALSSLFSGTRQVSTEIYTLDVIPTEATDKMILCRFSEKLGMLDDDDMAGEPVYISVKPQNTLPDVQTDGKPSKQPQGVYYNVPVTTSLEVYGPQDSYAVLDTPMAQFGSKEVLSNVLFDKRTTTKVSFYQSTGGIKKIEE